MANYDRRTLPLEPCGRPVPTVLEGDGQTLRIANAIAYGSPPNYDTVYFGTASYVFTYTGGTSGSGRSSTGYGFAQSG